MYDYNIPDEYRPISMWGYFGYSILFAIPIVGLVLIIVFSLGGTRNINVRNYARSYFCWLIIAIIIIAITFAFGGSAFVSEYLREISHQI